MNCARRTWLLAGILLLVCAGFAFAQEGRVQIASPQPGLSVSGESVAVKVLFTAPPGQKVDLVELLVDGNVHASRVIAPAARSGACTLQWDTAGFEGGAHALIAVARDTAGANTRAELSLMLARPRASEGGIRLLIESPKPNATVSGTTAVKLRAEHPSGVRYVMLFVDDAFAFMTNKPPFEYLWDTRRLSDGMHTLTAKAEAGDGQAATSAPVDVAVQNSPLPPDEKPAPTVRKRAPAPTPSGATENLTIVPMSDVRPMAPAAVTQPSRSGTLRAPSRPAASSPPRMVAPRAAGATIPTTAVAPASGAANISGSSRSGETAVRTTGARLSLPAVNPPAPQRTAATAAALRPETWTSSGGIRIASAALASSGSRLALPLLRSAAPQPAAPAAKARERPAAGGTRTPAGSVETVGATLRRSPIPSVATDRTAARAGLVTRAPHGFAPQVTPRIAVPVLPKIPAPAPSRAQPPALYMNGRPLATEPGLAVRGGVALGPFRQIVQHCGGAVTWDTASRTVSASILARDIKLTLGSTLALVDERPVALSAAPFIERSHTMVPLRFFSDALYFTVEYDPATGRICIYR